MLATAGMTITVDAYSSKWLALILKGGRSPTGWIRSVIRLQLLERFAIGSAALTAFTRSVGQGGQAAHLTTSQIVVTDQSISASSLAASYLSFDEHPD